MRFVCFVRLFVAFPLFILLCFVPLVVRVSLVLYASVSCVLFDLFVVSVLCVFFALPVLSVVYTMSLALCVLCFVCFV